MKRLRWLVLGFAALIASPSAAPAGAGSNVFDPTTGYRIAQYRAPTPATVPGGSVITLEDLDRLVADARAVLVDVMPAEGAGPDPVTGAWRLSKPRLNMAGSVWLPDVGKGELSAAMDRYFRRSLARLTADDPTRAVVIYCQADCWMAWNAVKRAASYGYTALYWYPDGTDGMRDWDRPLVKAEPWPVIP